MEQEEKIKFEPYEAEVSNWRKRRWVAESVIERDREKRGEA